MEAAQSAKSIPLAAFAVDSLRLIKRCTKPDRKGEEGSKDGDGSIYFRYSLSINIHVL